MNTPVIVSIQNLPLDLRSSHVSCVSQKVTNECSSVESPVNRRGFAESTGHAASPATIVIQKSVRPRKAATPVKTRKDLYDELPPTPTAPTAMFVSPMSGEKRRGRKSPMSKVLSVEASPALDGVREIMRQTDKPKLRKSTQLTGVKELMQEPKPRKSTQLAGVKELMREQKPRKSAQLTGVRELLQEEK